MITKDLGAVSAYAYAVEKGYTGTEAEYAELMASYATVAQQASQSAQTATEKAQQASASATSASQSASTASASAQTAQTAQQTATAKASEAQQSATTATTKAQEASQSASESSQSASTAVQAKQDAQTAKTASETAQASAESSATTAQTAAQTATQKAAEAAESARTLTIDPTLSQSGQAADAKEVGNALAGIQAEIPSVDSVPTQGSNNAVSSGGVYESINEISGDLETNFHINGNVKPNLVVGSFVNATNNNISQNGNFSMTEPIAVKKGQQVTLTATGYNQVVGMITTCNADNTERVTVVVSVDSSEHDYIYNVTEDGYIICSFDNRYNHKIALSIDYYSMNGAVDLLDYQKAGTADLLLIKNINRMVVGSNGTVQTSDNFFISQSINLYKGQIINLTASGYNTAVAMISLYDAESDTYTPLVISVDSTERTYTYTATSTCVVRCSMRWYKVTYSATIYTPSDMLGAFSALDDKSLNDVLQNIEYPQLFDNVLCIGDSLTVGYDGSGDTPLVKNYPHFLKKLIDAEMTKKAHGGWTTKQIWDDEISTATDLATYDCAIIFLGTNGGLTDTVSTDCKVDYTQNADTNTGCYGKIIGKIKATAPNCKIFVVAGVNDYIRRATTMNPAVRALADFYSVGLIDVENCIMSDSGGGDTAERYLYRPIDGIHYNALGYMTLANMFYDAMNLYMGKNRSMYT